MARLVVATYMVRYPLGGMLSWALQYALGLKRLGHDVLLVERANYPNACFDPALGAATDNGARNFRQVADVLKKLGFEQPLVFEDYSGVLHGMSRVALVNWMQTAAAMVDIGNHGAWLPEARDAGLRTVRIDGEPGYTQIKMAQQGSHDAARDYDVWFTNGANIGTSASGIPGSAIHWHHVFNPVDTEFYSYVKPPGHGCFTTVMNWQAHAPLRFNGHSYGQKDVEFERFMSLPGCTAARLEVAAAGNVPEARLRRHGWHLRDALAVTESLEAYRSYITCSLGEFSVCKNVFVKTRSGWFSDRSAAYLASGRPVVLQDTGFSAHLPCGEGLFAVNTVDEAAAAIDAILSHYQRHAEAARELAVARLEASRLMREVVSHVGL